MKKLIAIIAILILILPSLVFAARWKVPDGYTVKVGRTLGVRSEIPEPTLCKGPDGKIWGPEIFGTGKALELGFRPIRQETYDSENYTADATETDTGTEWVKGWTNIQPKMSLVARKKAFGRRLKSLFMPIVRKASQEIRELQYLSPGDADIAKWQQYKSDLKTAYGLIKADVISIADYDDLILYIKCEGPDPDVTYGYCAHVPKDPFAE